MEDFQVAVLGDFYQLPPVPNAWNPDDAVFCFKLLSGRWWLGTHDGRGDISSILMKLHVDEGDDDRVQL